MKAVRLKVSGKVQGVFYREETRQKAAKLGLAGYAENKRDGTVEVLACGDEAKAKQLIEFCKVGPLLAKVDKVDVEYIDVPDDEYEGFWVKG
ncbi:hypothetical protein AUJ68_02790 [Candidatus Woesearchaeota archaeon CG1_02_57_44]|nr:MAG: hypothetical protein AUJ68_02790 [Candidatus Woesearchaeota archaeon CG1_02_57_44]PIN69464.1 MAG: acylphosphatase [Candidatus Woesearchaeota archaeon CG11_big_fil_rev_8_21_14_0_20_57_5]